MSGAYDSEVAVVECGDLGDLEPFCLRHHRSVDRSERPAPMAPDELGDTKPVPGGDGLANQVASGKVTQETDFGVHPEPAAQQIGHLGHDQDGHDQGTRVRFQELKSFSVVVVVGVDVGVERSGVDEDRWWPAP